MGTLEHTALAWAFFSSGLASGSKVNAVTPACLLSSTILRSASSAVTLLFESRAASIAPCCLSSLAACAVAILHSDLSCSCSCNSVASQLVQWQCRQHSDEVCCQQQLGRWNGTALGVAGTDPLVLELRSGGGCGTKATEPTHSDAGQECRRRKRLSGQDGGWSTTPGHDESCKKGKRGAHQQIN